jgi:hypothetical protein
LAFCSLALCGCSSQSTLTGTVIYKGRAVKSGSVIVLSADGTARSGVIRPDGTYSVEGVPRGTARLGIFSPDPARARSILNADENREKRKSKGKTHTPSAKSESPGWFPIPLDYGDPRKTTLTCEVDRGHVVYDIVIP